MNGPQHYAEAERLLAKAAETYGPENRLPRWTPEGITAFTAEAQVHATLALVAVTAEQTGPGVDGPARVSDADDWERAIGRAWDQ